MPATCSNTSGATAPPSTTWSGLIRTPAPPKSSSGRKCLQSNTDQPDKKRARRNDTTGPEGDVGASEPPRPPADDACRRPQPKRKTAASHAAADAEANAAGAPWPPTRTERVLMASGATIAPPACSHSQVAAFIPPPPTIAGEDAGAHEPHWEDDTPTAPTKRITTHNDPKDATNDTPTATTKCATTHNDPKDPTDDIPTAPTKRTPTDHTAPTAADSTDNTPTATTKCTTTNRDAPTTTTKHTTGDDDTNSNIPNPDEEDIPYHGSSRATSGIFRGGALGNNPKHADFPAMGVGKVLVFTSRGNPADVDPHTTKPTTSIRHPLPRPLHQLLRNYIGDLHLSKGIVFIYGG
ncbi:hypothetical protein BD779DRAFT_1482650 [Infundibulicybe gibba]|nr:hypothetical protein BD779DRAFT_1482650 [Infundibulicybe gibba]